MSDDGKEIKKAPTLSDRLEAVLDNFENRLEKSALVEEALKAEKGWQFPITDQQFCEVCGLRRLDPDPTGLTCGNISCINEVVGRLREDGFLIDSFKEAVEEMRLKTKTSGYIRESVSKVFAEIKKDYEDWSETGGQIRREIAPTLGVVAKEENGDDRSTADICEDIAKEIHNLKSTVDVIERRMMIIAGVLGVKTEEKDLEDICIAVAKEIGFLQAKIEEIENKTQQRC